MSPLARLEKRGADSIRRLRCASPPVIHHVVPAGLEMEYSQKNENSTDLLRIFYFYLSRFIL
jgi:hypothetical protein